MTPPNQQLVPFTPTTTPAVTPARQLSDLPVDELAALAEELGLDVPRSTAADRPALVAAIHARRQLVAGLDRDALLEVVRWGRRPVMVTATKEQIGPGNRPGEVDAVQRPEPAAACWRWPSLRGLAVADADPVPTRRQAS